MRAWFWIAVAAIAFAAVTEECWRGRLGVAVLALLVVSAVAFAIGRRQLHSGQRRSVDTVAKTVFTVVGMMALLRHPIDVGGSAPLPIYDAIIQYLPAVDARTFFTFALLAMLVKLIGVVSSAYSWHLLLIGQRIRYPFWSAIMTAFLIGRFIGTFLPSTIGLDGYTLYEAGRYSNQWSRAVTAKALEKLIGMAGLFLGMVITLPFGYAVLIDVTAQSGRPQAAPLLAAIVALVGGGVSAAVIAILVWPVLLTTLMRLLGRRLPGGVRAHIETLTRAVSAYRGQAGLLFAALFSKFITHFTTAVPYYFTALAIGVTTARFWPIVFGSMIQIIGTVFSPTIAGEGAREAFQAMLLSKQLGGVAQAVLSGALGFIAAEGATLWGGAFLWVRKPGWRPPSAIVDGQQVDYSWIDDQEPGGLGAARLAAATAGR